MPLARFNPLRALLLAVGRVLAWFGLVDGNRVRRTTDLAWPRILTGLARMSKGAADVAMVGIAVGPAAIAVAAASVIFSGIGGVAKGPLRASGDTRWPLYAQLFGMYVVAIPVAALGVVTPLGITALYAMMAFEKLVPAGVIYARYRTGTWKVVSRSFRPDVASVA